MTVPSRNTVVVGQVVSQLGKGDRAHFYKENTPLSRRVIVTETEGNSHPKLVC